MKNQEVEDFIFNFDPKAEDIISAFMGADEPSIDITELIASLIDAALTEHNDAHRNKEPCQGMFYYFMGRVKTYLIANMKKLSTREIITIFSLSSVYSKKLEDSRLTSEMPEFLIEALKGNGVNRAIIIKRKENED